MFELSPSSEDVADAPILGLLAADEAKEKPCKGDPSPPHSSIPPSLSSYFVPFSSAIFEVKTNGFTHGCKPMDAEDCEPFTDVYWIKFSRPAMQDPRQDGSTAWTKSKEGNKKAY
ncbi:hypothetical protein HPP92_004504 [Vanilla planifolia]|uniref:Uncharacterized protein n=1 Tax=Vanilla planifolia TaxID=51239 RepID=A0A835RZJ9_VANPL|nr:hypothetical protein HPP92_004504 [Vanilla planifolia]